MVEYEPLFGEFGEDKTDPITDFESIIRTAANSRGFFKHQQRDEPDLTVQDKEKLARDMISSRPAVFLQRFGQYLSEEQLEYFEGEGTEDNYEVQYYLQKARESQCKLNQHRKVKNRRYLAMKKMLDSSAEHFTQEAMKQRNPLLYEQLIGKFKTEEEKQADDAPDMTDCSLSNIILKHIDITNERDTKKKMEEVEDDQIEEVESDDESDDEEDIMDESELAKEDEGRNILKKEFLKAAYNSFLDGKDVGVNYKEIDNDSSYDDLDLEDRDAEEKYFDEDDDCDVIDE